MNLNKVQLIGRVTRDPELKALPSGTSVCSFSLATNYVYKNKAGEKVEDTEFHNITVFGKRAEVVAQYVVKGQELYVEGRLKTDKWEKDGQTHYTTKIMMENFGFGQKPKGYEKPAEVAKTEEPLTEEEIKPEDIPF